MRDLFLAIAVSATILAAVWNDPDFTTGRGQRPSAAAVIVAR